MRDDLNRLMALQVLDRGLRELDESLATISAKVDQLRDETTQSQQELERLSEEEKQAALVRKQLERELAEGEARIRNHRMRLNLIRNDKELQAIGHEVESQKETNQRLEADLLVQMEAAEQRAPRIKELSELVRRKQGELAAAEKDIAAQVEEVKMTLVNLRAERDAVAIGIDETLRQRYEMIFNRRGGAAIVTVKSGICQGCRMRIPPQLYNEIQRQDQIHFCPNCQRILYFEA